MTPIIVLAHNIRSSFNVGSIFRTCEGFGIDELWLSGYTPYPDLALSSLSREKDARLPHIVRKLTGQISKSALGAEAFVPFVHTEALPLTMIKDRGFRLIALEQSKRALPLQSFHAGSPVALILGEERFGISADILQHCDEILEIPMFGRKESFNVSVAAGIALYQLRFG